MSNAQDTGKPALNHVNIGIQPTCWTNDDFPEIGNDRPYQEILDQTHKIGFQGGSTGHNYPTHLPSLQYALKTRELGITSTWISTQFTAEGQYDATIQEVRDDITFLKSVNATDIVVAELAAAVNTVRTKAVLTDRPEFNDPQRFLLYRGLNEAGKIAAEEGMRLSYHPHVGSGVQKKEEIDDLMANTDPRYVWLCLDSAHIKFAGDDPGAVAQQHAARIGHVHLKSVRQKIVDRATKEKYSFFQAILEGVFTVPGDVEGGVDFDPIFDALKKGGFYGWLVVEAEQDPAKADPWTYASIAWDFITKKHGINAAPLKP